MKKKIRNVAFFLVGLGVAFVAFFLFISIGEMPPTFLSVKEAHRSSEGVLLDRRGEPLHEIRSDYRERVLPWVSLEEVSPLLVTAVLRSEDKRFFRHPG
ncbi:MAG: transglycosylase domain-containing protein, partial [Syntrophorhabdaceae bacterium]|nr:transglycosylase domain-containing protein [Syntrophorhabdaceae bacterium]